jgi:acyl-CoA synthetase (AMP-forming)/AMP-acid ligase II
LIGSPHRVHDSGFVVTAASPPANRVPDGLANLHLTREYLSLLSDGPATGTAGRRSHVRVESGNTPTGQHVGLSHHVNASNDTAMTNRILVPVVSAHPVAEATTDRTAHDWLVHHANSRPDASAVIEWREGRPRAPLSFAAVRSAVDETAAGLRDRGVRPGDRVVISLPNAASFYCTLLACIAVGAVAVPAPTPAIARTEAFRDRVRGIVADGRPTLLVTETEWAATLTAVLAGGCPIDTHESIRRAGTAAGPDHGATRSPIALLQYTSGSTGRPRGVVVTHEAVRASCAQTAIMYAERPEDVGVTWVPLYHDQGLVTGIMRPLFTGYTTVLLSPQDFARSPLAWLTAISECGGTHTSAPNFAYELCVRKVSADRAARLDLRRWRVARNAGEVVRAETVDRFTTHFAPAGFAPEAMCPSYGMAEATLTVTTCTAEVRPRRLAVRRDALQRGLLSPVPEASRSGADETQWLLSSGVPVTDTRIRIGDDNGQVGPISISGPQLAAGYWGRGEQLDASGAQRWHDTGDTGFIHDGHLFVLGRADDTVVHRGRNFYLSDILAACATIPLLRPGRVAPFVRYDDETKTDEVYLVAELRAGTPPGEADLAALAVKTKHRLATALELFVSEVVFVAFGMLPVTTSGKVRASELRRRFASGQLPTRSTQPHQDSRRTS